MDLEYESSYELDSVKWNGKPLDNPESLVPNKPGTIDYADSGFVAVCGGFMGNESLMQQHYCDTVEHAITWLHDHGCSRIVNLCS